MHSTEQAGGTGGEKQLTFNSNRGIEKLIKITYLTTFSVTLEIISCSHEPVLETSHDVQHPQWNT